VRGYEEGKRLKRIVISVLVLFFLTLKPSYSQKFDFLFFSDTVNVSLNTAFLSKINDSEINENLINELVENFEKYNYQNTISDLKAIKKDFHLNDWYYYKLIRSIGNQIFYQEYESDKRVLFNWMALNKSGFDVRIAYLENQLKVIVYSDDSLVNSDFFIDKPFVLLDGSCQKDNFKIYNTVNSQGKSFSFSMGLFPINNSRNFFDDVYNYKYLSEYKSVEIIYPFNTISLLDSYTIDDRYYLFNVPFSPLLKNSLIATLKNEVLNEPLFSSVRHIYTFVQSSFPILRADGCSDQNIPEYILLSHGGELADNSSFLYGLIKEILNVPMIIVEGTDEDEVIIAVYLENEEYQGINYNNKEWLVCDLREEKFSIKRTSKIFSEEYSVIGMYPN
jgi:hypothetical protein